MLLIVVYINRLIIFLYFEEKSVLRLQATHSGLLCIVYLAISSGGLIRPAWNHEDKFMYRKATTSHSPSGMSPTTLTKQGTKSKEIKGAISLVLRRVLHKRI